MNNDFGKAQESIVNIMMNISSLKTKIEIEEKASMPRNEKLVVWRAELAKAEKALDKRRIMA